MELHSYSTVFALGHKALEHLWDGPVVITEKVDGSQVSWGVRDGELFIRSKNAVVTPDNPGMFNKAVESIQRMYDSGALVDGYTYRGEYLQKPKHNAIQYARVPKNHIALFDVDRGEQDYVRTTTVLPTLAEHLGLETVPFMACISLAPGVKPDLEDLKEMLQRDSFLGGAKVEGIVLKNYTQFGPDKKVLMAKLVREDFKETYREDWVQRNPSQAAFLDTLAEEYRTEARWMKAVQHLRDEGRLQMAPQDIPALMKEVVSDVRSECGDEMAERLFTWFWQKYSRTFTKGLPEWYKRWLAEN